SRRGGEGAAAEADDGVEWDAQGWDGGRAKGGRVALALPVRASVALAKPVAPRSRPIASATPPWNGKLKGGMDGGQKAAARSEAIFPFICCPASVVFFPPFRILLASALGRRHCLGRFAGSRLRRAPLPPAATDRAFSLCA